jgi:probable rRNA maturation factor
LAINFFNEAISFNLRDKRKLKTWFEYVLSFEKRSLGDINFVFSSDDYVLQINQQYLNHDYYTDIITFNYNKKQVINGDIFISIDTIKVNASEFSGSFVEELHRVMIHGILHLIGYNDSNADEVIQMRTKEDFYLNILYSKFLIK